MGTLDWVVIAGYFLVMVWIGWWSKRRIKNASDFFVAGGKVPWWLVGISHHMSGYSAAVFVGYAALAYTSLLTGLNKLEINEEALAEDLDAAWEVLAEPIQTVMRRFGVQGAYEKLKEVTRGKTVTAEALHALIQSLEIPQAEKDRLLAMTPGSYTGKAAELARRV